MKISEFSDLFGTNPDTIRYYVNMGLLVPRTHNKRYDFGAADENDMKFLLQLKNYQFSLHEIHRILALRRLSNFDSEDDLNDYLGMLKTQKRALAEQRVSVDKALTDINVHIREMAAKKGPETVRTGIPLKFLDLIACPHCGCSMKLSECTIENQEIMSGQLTCSCGYKTSIRNGILLGETGPVSIGDGMDLERNCYRMMSPELLSLVQRSYLWMADRLNSCDLSGKVVLEDCINNYCFCYTNFVELDPDALYIICDKFEPVVEMYKQLIEKLGLQLNILYIAAGSHQLPLKRGCVDYYIDYDSSNEFAILQGSFAVKQIQEYLSDDAAYVGVFTHFKPGCRSMEELYKEYPGAWQFTFNSFRFEQCLNEEWHEAEYDPKFGFVTDSGWGESFSYHVQGEKLWLSPFFCRK